MSDEWLQESGSAVLTEKDKIVRKAASDLATQREAFVIQEVSKSPLFQFFISSHFKIIEKSGPNVKIDGTRLSITQEIEVKRSLNLLKMLKFLILYPFYFFRRRTRPVRSEEAKK